MMNPNAFGDPGKMSDSAQFVCAAPGNDKGGVHTNSGVPNHAYALMVDGGGYNGFTITGIGLIKAGRSSTAP
jgi:Zn-dependent metalloprotease